jgi:hypothetical protein
VAANEFVVDIRTVRTVNEDILISVASPAEYMHDLGSEDPLSMRKSTKDN